MKEPITTSQQWRYQFTEFKKLLTMERWYLSRLGPNAKQIPIEAVVTYSNFLRTKNVRF